MKSGRPQDLMQGHTLLLESSALDEQFSHASRYDTHATTMVFPSHGDQLIDWIECLPQETFYHLARIVVTKMNPDQINTNQEYGTDHASSLDPLSKRELEVLAYIAAGLSNQEIAEALILTVGTVKRHINNIYTKINVHNRIQAVKYAQAHHLLPTR